MICGSESGEECISPASPEQAPQAAGRSPPGLNDMEMEVANELRALQRGVPSTNTRRPLACSPLSEVLASRVGFSWIWTVFAVKHEEYA